MPPSARVRTVGPLSSGRNAPPPLFARQSAVKQTKQTNLEPRSSQGPLGVDAEVPFPTAAQSKTEHNNGKEPKAQQNTPPRGGGPGGTVRAKQGKGRKRKQTQARCGGHGELVRGEQPRTKEEEGETNRTEGGGAVLGEPSKTSEAMPGETKPKKANGLGGTARGKQAKKSKV